MIIMLMATRAVRVETAKNGKPFRTTRTIIKEPGTWRKVARAAGFVILGIFVLIVIRILAVGQEKSLDIEVVYAALLFAGLWVVLSAALIHVGRPHRKETKIEQIEDDETDDPK